MLLVAGVPLLILSFLFSSSFSFPVLLCTPLLTPPPILLTNLLTDNHAGEGE